MKQIVITQSDNETGVCAELIDSGQVVKKFYCEEKDFNYSAVLAIAKLLNGLDEEVICALLGIGLEESTVLINSDITREHALCLANMVIETFAEMEEVPKSQAAGFLKDIYDKEERENEENKKKEGE